MAPHAVRRLTGPSQPWLIAYSALVAPVVLLLSDVLARVVLPREEVPVGIVTAFVGAPVLIALVRRRKVSGP
jgi:iron complex transport system permease protein